MRRNSYYRQHVLDYGKDLDFVWLKNKTIMITGVTGLIGAALADLLLLKNESENLNLHIIGVGRSRDRALQRLNYTWYNSKAFSFWEQDIGKTFRNEPENIDIIIHAASNAYPAVFAKFPVETMLANFIGTKALLDIAVSNNATFLLVSSGEVYGETDVSVKKENDYGYINILNPRSCYPNSKRAAETLCASYIDEYAANAIIARLSHVYGPTMTDSDNRVSSEFIRCAHLRKPLVLHSTGLTIRSYTYVLDACSGILCALKNGISGEAYNVSDERKIISIRDMAKKISQVAKVEYDFHKQIDYGASGITQQVMSGQKLRDLGWNCRYDFDMGLRETLRSLED